VNGALIKKWGIDVVIAFLAWVITFTLICIIVLGLGFGPMGIIAGNDQPSLSLPFFFFFPFL